MNHTIIRPSKVNKKKGAAMYTSTGICLHKLRFV